MGRGVTSPPEWKNHPPPPRAAADASSSGTVDGVTATCCTPSRDDGPLLSVVTGVPSYTRGRRAAAAHGARSVVHMARADHDRPDVPVCHDQKSTNTDPYQQAEGKYHLTQGIIGVLGGRRNPFSILTKSTLVLRDLRQLADASRRTHVRANLSIGTLDRDVWRLTEPGTPPPDKRVEAVSRLNAAGVPCGVLVAPLLPGRSDSEEQVAEVVTACSRAGAVSVTPVALHLRPGVREHYLSWLATTRPDLMDLYEQRLRGRSYQPRAEQARLSDLVAKAMGVTRNVKPSTGSDGPEDAPSYNERRRQRQPTATAAAHGLAHQPPARPPAGPMQLDLFAGS